MTDLSNLDGAGCSAADDGFPDRSRTPRFDVDPDSPFADVVSVYATRDRAHFDAMRTTAGLFLDEVVEHLRLLNSRPDEPMLMRRSSTPPTATTHPRAARP